MGLSKTSLDVHVQIPLFLCCSMTGEDNHVGLWTPGLTGGGGQGDRQRVHYYIREAVRLVIGRCSECIHEW